MLVTPGKRSGTSARAPSCIILLPLADRLRCVAWRRPAAAASPAADRPSAAAPARAAHSVAAAGAPCAVLGSAAAADGCEPGRSRRSKTQQNAELVVPGQLEARCRAWCSRQRSGWPALPATHLRWRHCRLLRVGEPGSLPTHRGAGQEALWLVAGLVASWCLNAGPSRPGQQPGGLGQAACWARAVNAWAAGAAGSRGEAASRAAAAAGKHMRWCCCQARRGKVAGCESSCMQCLPGCRVR